MQVVTMEIPHPKVGGQHTLALDKGVRDALADYCRNRWPTNTAKHAAREWSLTLDEAKGVVAARTSIATLERIFKNGGWAVALPVLGQVIGTRLDQHLQNGIERHERQAEWRRALVRDLRVVGPSDAGERAGVGVRK